MNVFEFNTKVQEKDIDGYFSFSPGKYMDQHGNADYSKPWYGTIGQWYASIEQFFFKDNNYIFANDNLQYCIDAVRDSFSVRMNIKEDVLFVSNVIIISRDLELSDGNWKKIQIV